MKIVRALVFAFVIVMAFDAPAAQAADRLVTVTGEATVAVAPDTAVIRVGVNSTAKTAREAGDANSKQMTAVLAAIKEAGIADRDVQTSRLSLQPQYDSSRPGTSKLVGFQANNQVTINIRDIAKLPAVIDQAIAASHAGLNNGHLPGTE